MDTFTRDFLTTDLYKNAELKTYSSVTALSKATGIPKKLLANAKKKNCVGFNANNTVNWEKAKTAFEAMLDSIELEARDDIGFWNKENKKKDVALKELQIKKLERNLIEPEEVKEILIELATKQSVVIKRVFSELPPKLAGKNEAEIKVILDEGMQTIFNVLKDKLDNWQ